MLESSIAISITSGAALTLFVALSHGKQHVANPPAKPSNSTTAATLIVSLALAALGHYARSQGYSGAYTLLPLASAFLIASGTLFLALGGALVGGLAYLVTMGVRR